MRRLALFLYVPAVFVPTWIASCSDSDETPDGGSIDAAAFDVTTADTSTGNPDSAAGNDASTGNDATTGNDAAADAGTDAGVCNLPFADGGPFLAPSPYLQASDSPFAACAFTHYYHLATFEGADGGLPPGTTAPSGAIYPGFGSSSGIVDSVDGDDGFPNGPPPDAGGAHPCPGCQSWLNGADFTFNEAVLGGLPTHAGMVWTDDCNGCTVTFEAFHSDGGLIGTQSVSGIGTSGVSGETAEDRFFGLAWDGGIKRIKMTHNGGGIEIDHLQIGR